MESKTCLQPDYRDYCSHCEGIPGVAERLECERECSETKWKWANEEYIKCVNEGGTPSLSEKLQREIQEVAPGFKLPTVPEDVPEEKVPQKETEDNLPAKTKEDKSEAKETTDLTSRKEVKVKNLTFGEDIKEGDTIRSEKNTITVIHLPNDSVIHLHENSQITFKSETSVEADQGLFKFLFIKLGGKPLLYDIKTNTAVAAVRGTEFLVDSDISKTVFRVLDGTLEVSDPNKKKTVEVTGGNQITVEKGKLPQDPKPFDVKSLDHWYETESKIPNWLQKYFKSYYLYAAGIVFAVLYLAFFFRSKFTSLVTPKSKRR